MSFINHNAKEIHCKIVYYGPSLGGKTTNIQWIYHKISSPEKSELTSLNTDNDRTVFFDFLPIDIGEIRGFKTRFHLYSVPGQIRYDASRKLILKGIDGVIFVADSQEERKEENLESMANLEINLEQQGYNIKNLPMALQYNKRDLPDVLPIAEMRSLLNKYNSPDFEACASKGHGVFEPLKTISKSIITTLKGGSL